MKKEVCTKFLYLGVLALFFIFLSAPLLRAERGPTGNIIGFVYAQDGTTPLEGAVIKFRNLTSGAVYESSKSDDLGLFRLARVDSGMYSFGVMSAQGDFNADNVLGIRVGENETAKMSIAVRSYSKDEAEAMTEIYRNEEPNGETLVAIIAGFDPSTQMGNLQMVKGMIRVKDKVHAKGQSTDFYQDVAALKVGDTAAQQILGNQTGSLKLDRGVFRGDRLYLVRNRKIFPFFLTPVGVAAVIAGNSAVTYGYLRIKDVGEPVSNFK